ncbi:MAG: DNA polymerase I, partial [Candidatus Firestonebacteria bacterium]|nr:DNA polymerase I [Candidatus Firestonebacteria bacterium]
LLNPSRRDHSIDALSIEYLGIKKSSLEDLIGKGKNKISLDQIEINSIAEYSSENADIIIQLKQLFFSKLKEEKLELVFTQIEIPLITALCHIEINGIKLDTNYLNGIKAQVELMLKKYEKDIYALAGEEFNINSPRELGRILFDKMGLPVQKKGKTGYSTDVDVLEKLSSFNDLPLLALNYRQLIKLNSTYVDALPKLVNPITGRLHTSLNQTITATGRLSSSEPNLQNIPVRSEFGKSVRGAFIAESKKWQLISGDYSQIELLFLAHFSLDENLMQAFKNGEDIHIRTACELFNVTSDKVDSNLRRIAKTINFGIVYGMSAFGLARDLKINQTEAQMYIDNYFIRYAGVKNFIDQTISEAIKNGYVSTIMGRKRYVPELANSNRNIREFGERIAINTPLQGSAADLIKIAMIKISDQLIEKNLKTKIILQVHDELIFEASVEEIDEVSILIKNTMEHALSLNVPIRVNMKKGNSWLELD